MKISKHTTFDDSCRKKANVRISKHTIFGQFYVLPYIKITYDRTLNGEYEFIVGWMSIGISLSFKPKQNKEDEK